MIRSLTDEEADDRFGWLSYTAGLELATGEPDERTVEKLHEVARVAKELAKHYADRLAEETGSGRADGRAKA